MIALESLGRFIGFPLASAFLSLLPELFVGQTTIAN
jgi:hypothetical protein